MLAVLSHPVNNSNGEDGDLSTPQKHRNPGAVSPPNKAGQLH
jgi:hypothetical protein